jgi:hypothetical protein
LCKTYTEVETNKAKNPVIVSIAEILFMRVFSGVVPDLIRPFEYIADRVCSQQSLLCRPFIVKGVNNVTTERFQASRQNHDGYADPVGFGLQYAWWRCSSNTCL